MTRARSSPTLDPTPDPNWFTVDKDGLAKLIAKRGKHFVVFELLQNALDEPCTQVTVTLAKETRGLYRLVVADDSPEGWADLRHAWTLYAESPKKADPTKRGRFAIGEKLVLALCEEATITTTTGTVQFSDAGRVVSPKRSATGSRFDARIRMTVEEYRAAELEIRRLIPTKPTTFNGQPIPMREPLATFTETLPTITADEEGQLRRTERRTEVRVYAPLGDETPMLYEMGIPVVEIPDKWSVDVGQKVPLNSDRDNVPPAYLRTLRVAVLNALHERLTDEDARETWVREASGDARATPTAVGAVMTKAFGAKRVSFDPSDPEASKRAVAQGYHVVGGAALTADQWRNVRRDQLILAAGKVTPSTKVTLQTALAQPEHAIPPEAWTPDMQAFVTRVQALTTRLPALERTAIPVRFVNAPNAGFQAAYSRPEGLIVNVAAVGYSFFTAARRPEQLALLIHELGHHLSDDHLAEEYHDALCTIGAELTLVALGWPEVF